MDRRSLLKAAALGPALAGASAARAETAAPIAGAGVVESAGPARPRYAEAQARLRDYMLEHQRTYVLPALTFVACDQDGWRCAIDIGTADFARTQPLRTDHLFQIGSISKSIVALALWRTAAAGRLDLSGDARALLPDAPWPDARISVRNLLEHSSGLPDDAPVFPRGGDGRLWTGYAPGSHWSYSNTGYDLLGLILERAHGGRRLGAILEAEVLRPLGMVKARGSILSADRGLYPASWRPFRIDATYAPGGALGPADWVDVTFGAGCVAAPSRDMAAWLRWLMGAANGRGGGRLPDAQAAAFSRATIDAPGWGDKTARYGNGLATVRDGERSLIHHTGGMVSFSSAFHVDSAAGVGAFASTPIGETGYRPRAVTLYACRLLRAAREGSAWPDPPPVRPPAKLRSDLDGRYTGPGGKVLTVRGADVTLEGMTGRLEPAGEDVLALHPRLDRYGFVPERKGGKVTGVWSGAVFFAAPGVAPPPPPPARLAALAGRYDSDDPWSGGPKRIVARADGLYLDGADKLTPLPDGSWRSGDEDWSPERVRFDGLLDGRPHRMTLSGRDFVRRPEPDAL